MLFYLDHPKHGTHICYDLSDVEKHKALGWVPRGEKPARVVGANLDGDGVIDQVFKKKPGRPKRV